MMSAAAGEVAELSAMMQLMTERDPPVPPKSTPPPSPIPPRAPPIALFPAMVQLRKLMAPAPGAR